MFGKNTEEERKKKTTQLYAR